MLIEISQEIRADIAAHARDAFPAECCGYVRGTRDAERIIAIDLVRCRNAQLDGVHPTHPERVADTGFVIAGHELFDFARTFRTALPAVVVYHSHTNGRAYFSAVDRENAVARGPDGHERPVYDVTHLVVGVTERGVTEAAFYAWFDDKRDFVEVAREVLGWAS